MGSRVPNDLSPVMQWSGMGMSQLASQKPLTEVQPGVGVQRWGSSLAGHFQGEGLRVIVRRHCGIFVAGNVEDEVSRIASWFAALYAVDARESWDTHRWYSEAPSAARALGTPCLGRTLRLAIISMPLSLAAMISRDWAFYFNRVWGAGKVSLWETSPVI